MFDPIIEPWPMPTLGDGWPFGEESSKQAVDKK